MPVFDKNQDGVISKAELKEAIKNAIDERLGGNLNKGQKMAQMVKRLVFLNGNLSDKSKYIYLGAGTGLARSPASKGVTLENCHFVSGRGKDIGGQYSTWVKKSVSNGQGFIKGKSGPLLNPSIHSPNLSRLRK